MNRSRFLKRMGGLVLGLTVARHIELPPAVAAPAEVAAPLEFTDVSTPLVASGGLCAPLSPFYELPPVFITSREYIDQVRLVDVRLVDALPSFKTEKGGIRTIGP